MGEPTVADDEMPDVGSVLRRERVSDRLQVGVVGDLLGRAREHDDGRPLLAVWHDEAIWFTTGPDERKARNLSHNAACILTTGRSDRSDGGLEVVGARVGVR
jgi:general stress protein 26